MARSSMSRSATDAERDLEVLDIQPGQRHLLLLVREPNGSREEKHKFLCGHDERDWFAAAVPETSGVATVRTAMEALKPREVLAAQARKGLKARHRNRRHNKAFIRQGEWFFIPEPDLVVDPKLVLEQRAAGTRPRQAALGGVPVPERRSERLRLLRVPAGTQRVGLSATDRREPGQAAAAVARDAAGRRSVRSWQNPPPGPQDGQAQRVAPGRAQHREPGGFHEASGVSRLIRAGRRPHMDGGLRMVSVV